MSFLSSDDQYRQLWSELERLIRAHADTSPQHKLILDCVLECKKADEGRGDDVTPDVKKIKTENGARCDAYDQIIKYSLPKLVLSGMLYF